MDQYTTIAWSVLSNIPLKYFQPNHYIIANLPVYIAPDSNNVHALFVREVVEANTNRLREQYKKSDLE